jgi:hypothetical protein
MTQHAADDYYELRLYRSTPGRTGDLHHRMGWEVPPLFERHGVVQPLVYWDGFAGIGAPLYGYLLRWRSLDERFRAFRGFYADAEWGVQLTASNAGEAMIERMDLSILRAAPAWTAGVADDRLAAATGLHELRIQRLSTHNSPQALQRLSQDDLPFLAEHGGKTIGLFTTWFGSRTPQAVMLIEWPDFATREAALRERERAERSSQILAAERGRYGGPLTLDYDVHLMKPAVYPARG